jgi:hypothetical protein
MNTNATRVSSLIALGAAATTDDRPNDEVQ